MATVGVFSKHPLSPQCYLRVDEIEMAAPILVGYTLSDMGELYEELFNLAGHECVTFPLTLPLCTLPRHDPVLLVFDDILLAAEEGFALLHKLRRTPELASVPVIVCSSMLHTALDNACFLGALDIHVLIKPFELDTLLDLTERLLQRRE